VSGNCEFEFPPKPLFSFLQFSKSQSSLFPFSNFQTFHLRVNSPAPMDPPAESAPDSSTRHRSQRPRLFIKEMIMRNFKSYAGEQRVGPFHKVRVCRSLSNFDLLQSQLRTFEWRVYIIFLEAHKFWNWNVLSFFLPLTCLVFLCLF